MERVFKLFFSRENKGNNAIRCCSAGFAMFVRELVQATRKRTSTRTLQNNRFPTFHPSSNLCNCNIKKKKLPFYNMM